MIRHSSKQATSSSDSAAAANADSPRQDTDSADQAATYNSGSTIDSTHQSSEAMHEKSDQKLEATDPDLTATTSDDSSTIDQVNNAVDTSIDSEIQEEEPVRTDNADAGNDGGSLGVQEEEESNPESKVHSIQLAGHIKGVPKQVHHSDHGQRYEHRQHDHDQSPAASVPKDIESNTAETNRQGHGLSQHSSGDKEGSQEVEEMESTKHAKRTADDQAKERHDYIAGAYKSPFRHTHKVEKVGREEL
ncbi:hypothetical protein EC957_000290 [Mortierella hygrophila]|uniref:Uncharacterized protein n=1 Tax=Mortierella hygrophila TaxID=979708 RepID=A0A9P6F844_9FUNG|nr:hypothetical protein EC957_000290 [Mortierella hygrophila]